MKMKDNNKIIIVSFIILLISLLVTMSVTYFSLMNLKHNELVDASQSLESVLSATREGIDVHIEEQFEKLIDINNHEEFIYAVNSYDKNTIEAYLLEKERTILSESLTIIDKDFNLLFSNDEDPEFIGATEYEKYFSKATYGEKVFIAPLDENLNRIYYIMPILDKGEVTALVIISENPEMEFTRLTNSGVIGQTGETYAFNERGLMITTSRFDDELVDIGLIEEGQESALNIEIRNPGRKLTSESPFDPSQDLPYTLMIYEALNGIDRTNISGYLDYRGVNVNGTWTWSDQYQFGLVTEIDVDDSLRTYYIYRSKLLIAIITSAVLISLGVIIIIVMSIQTNKALYKSRELLEKTVQERTQELAVTNENFKLAIDALTHPFYVIDVDTYEVIIYNKAAKALTQEEFTTCHKLTRNLDSPCSNKNNICPIELVKESKEPVTLEHINRDENGNVIYSEVHGYPILDEFHRVTRMIEYSLDITEKKQASDTMEEALNQTKRLFDTSLALSTFNVLDEVLNALLSNLLSVVNYDRASIFTYKEDTLKLIHSLGYENDKEMKGLEFSVENSNFDKGVIYSKKYAIYDDASKFDDFILLDNKSDLKSRMSLPLIFQDEIIGILSLDSYEINFYTDETAEITSAFATLLAIAIENAKHIEKLESARKIAEEATKAKSDFLANMSHEIRTPMNAVIGLNGLLERTELNSKQRDYVSKVGNAAKNLLGIINDILDFSKIEAGKMSIENINFKLDDVLDNLSNVVGLKAYNKNLEFITRKDTSIADWVVGDPLRLGQILLNLVNNAIKFTEDGEVIVEVKEVQVNEHTIELIFSVKDSGIGMSIKQQNKLFKAFSQADESTTRKYGGTGLGLTISKELVELMNGNIWVESEEGKGSSFIFTAVLGKSLNNKSSKLEHIPVLNNKKCLIVDDNDAARDVIGDYVSDFGIEVLKASSGEKAVEIISESFKKNQPIDIVFMDWKMGGITGIEAWHRVVESGIKPLPKIIIITAYSKEEVIVDAIAENIDHILIKPVNQSQLYNAILKEYAIDTISNTSKQLVDYLPKDFDNIRGANILLVEDNEINQQVARELLEIEGFYVDVANDGLQSIDKVKENNYDIILMDLQMPKLDGYGASKHIREKLKMEKIPIIALSADAMSDTRNSVLESGMNDYVAKPIDRLELFKILKKWIQAKDRIVNTKNTSVDHTGIDIEDLRVGLPDVEVTNALERVGGNVKLYCQLLMKFSKDFNWSKLGIFDDTLPMEVRTREAHSLKGVSGNIGAKKIEEIAKKIEGALNSKKDIDRYKEALKVELENVGENISSTIVLANEAVKKKIIDPNLARQLLDQLKDLVNEYDGDALDICNSILLHEMSKENAKSLEKVKSLIEDYEFEAASELLSSVKFDL